MLIGWGESGIRPKFDIVTGISAGALLSTFAFLGGRPPGCRGIVISSEFG